MKKITKTKSVQKIEKPTKQVVRIIKLPNKGDSGYTPVKDKDYFDGKTPVKGVDYNDGEPGYTPQKGVDYDDGEPGYTPIKGIDYFDGKPGLSGPRGLPGKSFPKEEVKKMVDKSISKKLPKLMEELEGKGQVVVEEGKDGYNLIINGKKHFVPNAVYGPKLRNFIQLGDSPGTYVGGAGKFLAVNATETGIEYITAGGGAVDSVNGQTGVVVLDAGDIAGFATVATTGSYNDLIDKPTIPTGTIDGTLTTNELVYSVDANTVGSLAVATYPSLAEIAHVKGVTSAIQTQLNNKEPLKGADDNYVTDAQLVVIGNTSGTNTGDQTSVTGNAGTATALATGRTIGTATGDVTSAGSSFDGTANNTNAYTIANSAVTLAKMADLAQDQFIGRTTASTGVPQTATITAAARTVLDDTTVGAMVDTLGGATSTGTGGLVRTTSPTLVTPALGTPSALVATNATGTATGLTSGITNALKSATTTVDVSAATAPSSGQALVATSSTTATWQSISGGYWDFAFKMTSDFTVTNSSVFADVTGMTFSFGSGECWYFEVMGSSVGNNGTGDIKLEFQSPGGGAWNTGSGGYWIYRGPDSTGSQGIANGNIGSNQTIFGTAGGAGRTINDGDNLARPFYMCASIVTTGSSSVQMQIANVSASSGRTSTIKAGTYMLARKLT